MSITINTSDQLKSNIVNQYKDTVPGLDLSDGSTENDILVSAPVDGSLASLEQQIGYVNLVQSLNNWSLMQDDDLENLVANVLGSNPRLQATMSSGTAFFYSSTAPSVNVTIPSGALISTIDAVQFVTTEQQVMFASIASTYYDATLNLWGIEVAIQSVASGSNNNIAAGLINTLVTSISGISVVNNKIPSTGGIDQESNQSLVSRALASFQSRGLESLLGIDTFMKQQTGVIDSLSIDSSSPLMIRDGGLGGKINTYIRGKTIQSFTQNSINTSSGYIEILQNVPVLSISSVIGNRSYLPIIDFNFVTSTGVYVDSVEELDFIVWTSTGVAGFGESISISYQYEALINNLQALMNDPSNHIPNRDILLYQTIEVDITVNASIFITGDPQTIEDSISTAIGNYINNLVLGSLVEKAEVLDLIFNTTGVNNIDTSSFSMNATGGTTTPIGDVQLSELEYGVALQPNITVLT